jgi:ribosomal protein S18 acetylase RimI-like enzyme
VSKFEIRLLSESDVDEYWQLRLRALKEEPTSFGSSYEESLDITREEVLDRIACNDEMFTFGCFTSALVGNVRFHRREGKKKQHKGEIYGVYVAPECRGRGIARALLEATIERAKTIVGVEHLTLSVVTANEAARNLYLSLGFETFGIEKALLKVGDQFFDEDLMSLRL